MGDISKERREQLRARSALYHADILIFSFDIDMTHAELRALLDAAAERDAALAEVQRLREAADALLRHYEGDEPHPEERRYDRWRRQLNVRLEELAVAVAAVRSLVEPAP